MGLGWIDYGRKGGTDRIEKGGDRFEISLVFLGVWVVS